MDITNLKNIFKLKESQNSFLERLQYQSVDGKTLINIISSTQKPGFLVTISNKEKDLYTYLTNNVNEIAALIISHEQDFMYTSPESEIQGLNMRYGLEHDGTFYFNPFADYLGEWIVEEKGDNNDLYISRPTDRNIETIPSDIYDNYLNNIGSIRFLSHLENKDVDNEKNGWDDHLIFNNGLGIKIA